MRDCSWSKEGCYTICRATGIASTIIRSRTTRTVIRYDTITAATDGALRIA